MSYASAAALQAAIYARLRDDAALAAVVGDAVYDTVPAGDLPPVYVSLGAERASDWSDKTGSGARHDLVISVATETAGFQTAKTAAAAISDALADPAALSLARGRLVSLTFRRAVARRVGDGQARRIDLTYRALVEDI